MGGIFLNLGQRGYLALFQKSEDPSNENLLILWGSVEGALSPMGIFAGSYGWNRSKSALSVSAKWKCFPADCG